MSVYQEGENKMPINPDKINHLPVFEETIEDLVHPYEVAELITHNVSIPHYVAGLVHNYLGKGNDYLAAELKRGLNHDGKIFPKLMHLDSWDDYQPLTLIDGQEISDRELEVIMDGYATIKQNQRAYELHIQGHGFNKEQKRTHKLLKDQLQRFLKHTPKGILRAVRCDLDYTARFLKEVEEEYGEGV